MKNENLSNEEFWEWIRTIYTTVDDGLKNEREQQNNKINGELEE